ncbi:unnamed protein product [Vitrella brassicaformis CCMP3155]|uniref:EF-hand domain-containing protein n=2 Tax=Vitrella brassicaformis TaxID=1169539 RepID=A0A0G4G3G7_VITBC|nr:unnamed protein product [Vitrella brassicaformis CCMP3155]|eukprot:CEM22698.1 unnamed protein product [Vitrella brassicaformis CCMP3155]
MGSSLPVAHSPILSYLKEQYNAALGEDSGAGPRGALRLRELQRLQPPDGVPIDFTHFPTLFVMDSNRDGLVDWHDLLDFAEFVQVVKRRYRHRDYEFRKRLKALCTLQVIALLQQPHGEDALIEWICKAVTDGNDTQHLIHSSTQQSGGLLSREALGWLFTILHIEELTDVGDEQAFFDLLQRVLEEQQTRQAAHRSVLCTSEEFDDLIPLSLIHHVLRVFIQSFRALSADVVRLAA